MELKTVIKLETMEIGKGKLKSLLRQAYMAGGRYYSKPHIKDENTRKAIGKTQSFDAWYKSQIQ